MLRNTNFVKKLLLEVIIKPKKIGPKKKNMKNIIKKVLSVAFVVGLLFVSGGDALAYTPSYISSSATNVTATSVTLNGTFNPNGLATTAWFEVQSQGQYGSQSIGSGTSNVSYTYNLTGLTSSTTYSFRAVAQNSTGTTFGVWQTFTTSTNTPPPTIPTATLTASPTSVTQGGSSTITWTVSNADTCTASNGTSGWAGPKSINGGTFVASPINSTTQFTLYCSNNYGSVTKNVWVYATVPPPPSNPTVDVTANPNFVNYGGSTTVTWSSTNANTCTASGNGWSGSKATSGSLTFNNLTSNTTYTLTCTGNGGSASDTASVTVGSAPQAPTVNISANPTNVSYNGTSTLSWSSTNATSCTATAGTNGWMGPKNTSGTFYTGNLTSTTNYIITCTGNGGTASDSATVSVGAQPVNPPTVNLTASPTSVSYGGSTVLSWNVTNATSCTANSNPATNFTGSQNANSGSMTISNLTSTTYFNLTCSGNGGTAMDTVNVLVGSQPVNPPTVSISANPTSINSGSSTTLNWSSTNANSCLASSFPSTNQWTGTKNTSGSIQISNLTNSTTFHISCTGNGGSASDYVQVTVNTVPPPTPAPTLSLVANPTSVSYGGSTVLSWNVTNATSCTANSNPATNWISSKNPNGGSQTISNLTSTTYFNLTCSGNGGTVSDTVTVSVGSQPQNNPTVDIDASPTSVNYGGSATLAWISTNATSCNATNGISGWSGPKNTSGLSFLVNLTNTQTFTITCSNSSGQSATDSVTINVSNQPPQGQAPTVTLNANNNDLPYNGNTSLYWYPTNATSCVGTGGSNNWSGSKSIYSDTFYTGNLTQTTTYNITCTNSFGSDSDSVTVYVASQPASNPTVTTNSPSNIGNNYATLNGYINSNNSSNVYAWFEWGTNGNYGNTTPQNYYGNSGTSYNYYLAGLSSNTTYYYRAVAQGQNGQMIYGNQQSFTTTGYCTNCGNNNTPSVTTYSATDITNNYATLNGYIDPNGSSTTRWFEWGTSYGNLYNSTNHLFQGTNAGNINQQITGLIPNTTYYFRAVAQNTNGTSYGNTLTFQTPSTFNNSCNTGSCFPTAVTTLATNIGQTSARLNGLGLLNGNNVSNTGYFEWGTTQALGNTTNEGYIGSNQSNPFYSSVFGLSPNTTYYYRAVMVNQYGVSRGDIVSFRTNGPLVNTNTNTNTTTTITDTRVIYRDVTITPVTNVISESGSTGLSRPSLVFLSVSRNNEIVQTGNVADYVVTYKNVSSRYLRDVVLQVALPAELDFLETTRGYFSSEDNTVVVSIGELVPGQEGSVLVTTRVLANSQLGKTIVVTGNLAYTYTGDDNFNYQEEVFAYSKNTLESGVNLQGAAIFGTSFLPGTLAGWLLLLLFILLIILLARMAYYNTRPQTVFMTGDRNRNNDNIGHL